MSLYSIRLAITETYRSGQYEANYEAVRNELEALNRTMHGKVNSAYTCRSK